MGVDSRWIGHAPMDDVAKAVGLLLGCRRSFETDYGFLRVEGVTTKADEGWCPTLSTIEVVLTDEAPKGADSNGTGVRSFWWHHEGPEGQRVFSTRATAVNMAIVDALGRLFGGQVWWTDCEAAPDATYPAPEYLWAEDGYGWEVRQARLRAVKGLTDTDVALFRGRGGYPVEGV